MNKFTVIWQSKTPHELDWIEELFGPLIKNHVYDGEHQVVMDDAILVDAFINRFDEGYYRQFAGKNAFLVHVLDETYAGGYDRYLYFKGVFREHFSARFNGDKVFNIPLGYYKKRPVARPSKPALQRPYIWSFVGVMDKPTRPGMLRALRTCSPFMVISTSSVYGEAGGARERVALNMEQYYQVIEDSVFSPSPMGNVNLECFRMYEALEAGSIPIIEKRLFLNYFRSVLGENPIPLVSRWSDAAKLIDGLLRTPERLVALQAACAEFWVTYKLSLRRDIQAFIERNAALPNGGRMYSPLVTHRIYAYFELLRHHNAGAVIWRIRRQITRLWTQRRWRVSG